MADNKSVKSDGNQSEDNIPQSEQDTEMMSMFASVWVKVEVDDDNSETEETRFVKSLLIIY